MCCDGGASCGKDSGVDAAAIVAVQSVRAWVIELFIVVVEWKKLAAEMSGTRG